MRVGLSYKSYGRRVATLLSLSCTDKCSIIIVKVKNSTHWQGKLLLLAFTSQPGRRNTQISVTCRRLFWAVVERGFGRRSGRGGKRGRFSVPMCTNTSYVARA